MFTEVFFYYGKLWDMDGKSLLQTNTLSLPHVYWILYYLKGN